MTYRLAFIRTNDGYLRITASARGIPSLTAIHVSPDVLALASRLNNIPEQDIERVKSTAEQAWTEQGLDVCCEAIELDSEQLKQLGFIEDWRRLA